MTLAEPERWIARESEAFAAVVDSGSLDGRVPGCPGWDLRALTWHLGNVQRFWAGIVRAGRDVQPDLGDERAWTGPSERAELAAWIRASTADLLDALQRTPYDTPAWAWWRNDHTVGAIARHQVQETAVHRWDAQSSAGTPDPLPQPEADDGVEEFVWLCRQLRDPAPIVCIATDSGLRVPLSDDSPAVTVSATASDLVLLFHRRIATAAVHIDGDASLVEEYFVSVD